MSVQSDAAKKWLEHLLMDAYHCYDHCYDDVAWLREYRFDSGRRWRFDYAVPALRVAIELDGGTFQSTRTGHTSGVALRGWREKNNAAMSAGWRVWHYAPDEIVKAGRKTIPDEPILLELPWLKKTRNQEQKRI